MDVVITWPVQIPVVASQSNVGDVSLKQVKLLGRPRVHPNTHRGKRQSWRWQR